MELPEVSPTGSPPPGNPSELIYDASPEVRDKPAADPPPVKPHLPAVGDRPAATTVQVIPREPFPHSLASELRIIRGRNGRAYSIRDEVGNAYVLPVGSKQLNTVIRKIAREQGVTLRKSDVVETNSHLQAYAETLGAARDVFYRVAEYQGGFELELGDEQQTRVRVLPGTVVVITEGSETLFYRTQMTRPMVMPAAVGDLTLLKKYLNLHPTAVLLLIAWIAFTLAHAKVPTSKYPILLVQGGQGSGKSWLCYIVKQVIDPSVVTVQMLPANGRDLAIDAQNAHVLCFDNVRELKPAMADVLCVAATGGALTTRQLYSDADQQVHVLHAAVVLNGIHSFIDQPDLAQRCLPITLLPITETSRKSESMLAAEFQSDLPMIFRGLLDLCAKVLTHLPTVEVTDPERMIDFVRWLAAMEKANGDPAGIYQGAYSDALHQGQLDSLLDNHLAAAVFDFAEGQKGRSWTGTPAELLIALNAQATPGTKRSREWPLNAIALSKRLLPLQASLRTQGITIEFGRGKFRTITIQGPKNEQDF